MSELLIPYGLHKDNDHIVEPEDATKGRACNCICPGCRAPVLAKHPKVNAWHFAHDSKHEDAIPDQDCPFSSSVAVAMMAREIAPKLMGHSIDTPEYQRLLNFACCSKRAADVYITKAHSVTIDSAAATVNENSHTFDIKLMVNGHTIYIDLIYDGKPAKGLLEAPLSIAKAGVIYIDCDSFSFKQHKQKREMRFSESVMGFLLTEGIRGWRYHPRQSAMIERIKSNHACEPINAHTARPARKSLKELKAQKEVMGNFKCLKCDDNWWGKDICSNCKSALYVTAAT